MSESAVNEQKTRQSLTESSPIKPWSLESDAERLMDDLFADLDGLLDGSNKLPTEPVKPDYVSVEPAIIPSMSLWPSPAAKEPAVARETAATERQNRPLPSPERPPAPQKQGFARYLDKILFGVACTSLLAVFFWLVKEGKIDLQRFFPQASWQNTATENAAISPSESDSQFINYMLRSLEVIDRQTASNTSSSGGRQLPPAPGVGNSTSGAAPQVIERERVYIPYQINLAPSGTLMPPPPAAAPAPAPPVPLPPAAPVPPPAPQQAQSPSAPSAPTPPPKVEPLPSGNHVLIGLIEMGGGSTAALFKIDGATQRISEGEAIGSSGWTLVSAANQNAIIRRNGEVRSVYVGQKF